MGHICYRWSLVAHCLGTKPVSKRIVTFHPYSDNKVHGANMGPTWVLSDPEGPHVGPMNHAIRIRALRIKFNTSPVETYSLTGIGKIRKKSLIIYLANINTTPIITWQIEIKCMLIRSKSFRGDSAVWLLVVKLQNYITSKRRNMHTTFRILTTVYWFCTQDWHDFIYNCFIFDTLYHGNSWPWAALQYAIVVYQGSLEYGTLGPNILTLSTWTIGRMEKQIFCPEMEKYGRF